MVLFKEYDINWWLAYLGGRSRAGYLLLNPQPCCPWRGVPDPVKVRRGAKKEEKKIRAAAAASAAATSAAASAVGTTTPVSPPRRREREQGSAMLGDVAAGAVGDHAGEKAGDGKPVVLERNSADDVLKDLEEEDEWTVETTPARFKDVFFLSAAWIGEVIEKAGLARNTIPKQGTLASFLALELCEKVSFFGFGNGKLMNVLDSSSRSSSSSEGTGRGTLVAKDAKTWTLVEHAHYYDET